MKPRILLIKTGVTIGFLFLSCIFFIETPPLVSRIFSKDKTKQGCWKISIFESTFIYGSCPNNTYIKYPGADYPKMITTISCTDSIGGRVSCSNGARNFDKNEYQTYLIGDSFIQAAEIDYKDSVYGLINNSPLSSYSKAYGLAFSSWNTRQYLKAIKAISKPNSTYDIYLFPNDISPRYSRSTYGEINSQMPASSELQKSYLSSAKAILSNSYTAKKIKKLFSLISISLSPQLSKRRNEYWNYHRTATFDRCPTSFIKNKIDSFSPIARDYIMYTYNYTCWDDAQKQAYTLVKHDLEKILSYGKSLNSKTRIILLPPGFSFPNENTPGRLHKSYDIPNDVRLSLFGLRKRLSQDFKKSLLDIEDVLHQEIKEHKKRCKNGCDNAYYFGNDGHFTKRGHSFLFKLIYSKTSD